MRSGCRRQHPTRPNTPTATSRLRPGRGRWGRCAGAPEDGSHGSLGCYDPGVSHSSSKNRHKRTGRRQERKRFRAAEKRIIRGDRNSVAYFSSRYAYMGTLRQKFLPPGE